MRWRRKESVASWMAIVIRQELTAKQVDDKHVKGSTLQELRGLEPSTELAVGYDISS